MSDLARAYQPKRKSLMRKLVTLFVFSSSSFALLISVGFLLFLTTKTARDMPIISPLAKPIQETYAAIRESISPNLQSTIQDALRGTDGEYGIVVKNLRTGETYEQHEKELFTSASLYKLWTMGTAYAQFENGRLKPTEFIATIASPSADLVAGSGGMTIANAINKSITISDNYAAHLLVNRLTVKEMYTFLNNVGMIHTTQEADPRTTPEDIALFYEKLYNKNLISETASTQMLTTLKQQQINDRIPKYLPPYIQVAHKTGELDGFKHDAGIVFTPQGDYIFIAMSNSDNPAIAAERIAILSQRVYAYFTKE